MINSNVPGFITFDSSVPDTAFDATGAHAFQSEQLLSSAFVAATAANPKTLAMTKSNPRQIFFSNTTDAEVIVVISPSRMTVAGVRPAQFSKLATLPVGISSFNVDSVVANGLVLPGGSIIAIYAPIAPTKGYVEVTMIYT